MLLGSGAAGLSFLIGRTELLAMGVACLALPLLVFGWRWLMRPRLTMERSQTPGTATIGDTVRSVATVHVEGFAPLYPANYRDAVGGTVQQLAEGVVGRVAGGLARTERRRSRRISYRVQVPRRGRLELGPLELLEGDPLGLTDRLIVFPEPTHIEVRPRPAEVRLPTEALVGGTGEGDRRTIRRGDAPDVISREYRRGDAVRRIDWRTTARVGSLRVRQDDDEYDRLLLVLHDVTGEPSELVDRDLERSVSLAAGIARRALADGWRVAFCEVARGVERPDAEPTVGLVADDWEGMLHQLAMSDLRDAGAAAAAPAAFESRDANAPDDGWRRMRDANLPRASATVLIGRHLDSSALAALDAAGLDGPRVWVDAAVDPRPREAGPSGLGRGWRQLTVADLLEVHR